MAITADAAPQTATETQTRRSTAASLFAYGGTVLVCVLLLVWALRLWRADLSVPILYDLDGLYYQSLFKGIVENGWYLFNDHLGQPGGMDLREFPISDGWCHYLIVKLLACTTHDYAVVFNLFYLLTFPLTAVSALFVLRRLGVSRLVAAVVSLLFTFLPFHLIRLAHPFLAAYYLVPIAVLAVVRAYQGRLRAWSAGALAIGILTGMGGVYYALFACFFLAVAGSARAYAVRSRAPLFQAGALAAVIFASLLVTLAPALHYRLTHAKNPKRCLRYPYEAEHFGLKIAQLALPVMEHRLPPFRRLTRRYMTSAPLVTENCTATLGLAGTFGFFWLLARLVLHRPRQVGDTADALVLLNVTALLLATVGGLSSLLAYAVSPWMRAPNRISVYIGFFALAALALLLEKARRRWAVTPPRRLAFAGLVAALLLGGILDQTTRRMVPPYEHLKEAYASDRDFTRRIEASLPPASFVFELPYGEFPEGPWTPTFADADLLRPYLHSRELRWSYGSLRGHAGAVWAKEVAGLAPVKMLPALAEKGAAGIYIDRRGYKDRAANLERTFTRLLGAPPLVSQNGNQVFFALPPNAGERHAAGRHQAFE